MKCEKHNQKVSSLRIDKFTENVLPLCLECIPMKHDWQIYDIR